MGVDRKHIADFIMTSWRLLLDSLASRTAAAGAFKP